MGHKAEKPARAGVIIAASLVITGLVTDIAAAGRRDSTEREQQRVAREMERAQREVEKAQRQAQRAEREARRAEREARQAEREARQAESGQRQTDRQQGREDRQQRQGEDRTTRNATNHNRDRDDGRSVQNARTENGGRSLKESSSLQQWIEGNSGQTQHGASRTNRSDNGDTGDRRNRSESGQNQASGKNKPRAAAAPATLPPHLELPSLGEREFLAATADQSSLATLMKLGFSARGSAGSSLFGTPMVRLAAPAGMSPARAKEILTNALPNTTVAQNRIYRPYQLASGTRPADLGAGAERLPASKEPCSTQRCYAFASVLWSRAVSACARGVRIGVIDTPVDLSHPTFTNSRISVGTFRAGPAPADDTHGTGVLALLAGNTASGTPGLLPEAEYMAVDVFFADTKGQPMTDTMSLLKAFEWMDASEVKVINMSLSGPRDDLVAKAVERMAAKGVIFTAAAGNNGPAAPPSYPAAYPQVISVTAVDRQMRAYRHANHGKYIDIAAPGVGVWTAFPGAKEGPETGTSFAVPFATAAVAAIYDSLPRKTKSAALAALPTVDLGAPGPDQVYGRGLLRAPQSCGQPAPSPEPPAASSTEIAQRPSWPEVLPWLKSGDREPARSSPPIGLGFSD